MRFEERELKPYAEPVSDPSYKKAQSTFALNFRDEDMLIPCVETRVFNAGELVKCLLWRRTI